MADLAAQTERDSLSSDGSDPAGPNWELLGADLGADALAALQLHLQPGGEEEARATFEEANALTDAKRNAPDIAAEDGGSKPPVGPVLVGSNLDFKKVDYWESRFQVEEEYEWLAGFSAVEAQLRAVLPPPSKNPRILVVGCGNSRFSADVFDAGWSDVTSLDFSSVVVDRMAAKHSGPARGAMKWVTGDMLTLDSFPDESFDVVLDKAAMDALMCDEGSVWDPHQKTRSDADAMCRAVSRVLRSPSPPEPKNNDGESSSSASASEQPSGGAFSSESGGGGGIFLQISFAQPHFRRRYLTAFAEDEPASTAPPSQESSGMPCEAYRWQVSHVTFGDEGCLENFLYVCRKL